jgi:ABC-type maltose transport system permease subunit
VVGLYACIFVAVFCAHFGSGVSTYSDPRWTVHTARSLIHEGNTDLDEYLPKLEADDFQGVEQVDGHYYQIFPIGAAVISVPFVIVLDPVLPVLADAVPPIDRYIRSRTTWEFDTITVISVSLGVERLIAAIVVACTAMVMFALARLRLRTRDALFVVFLFAFATPAWSVASRAMWQHGPSMLCLAIAMYGLLRAEERPRWNGVVGAALAFAFVVRPTNAIPIVIWTAYIAMRRPRQLPLFIGCAAPFAIAFVAYNWSVYASIFAPYYLPQRVGATGALGEALLANLISPGRGLFIYSPIFALTIVGFMIRVRDRTFDAFDGTVIGIIVLHWFAVSSFPHWWGGHSYGPRFMSDMVPLLLFGLFPVFAMLPSLRVSRRAAAVLVVACLSVVSVYMHARGALVKEGWEWNATPNPLDESPERIWDWSDPAFLR